MLFNLKILKQSVNKERYITDQSWRQETKNNRAKLVAKQQADLLSISEVKLKVPEKAKLLKEWWKQETVLKIE